MNIYSGGTGLNSIGAIAGVLINGTISNVFVTGSVTQVPGAGCGYCGVGGIVGSMGETAPLLGLLVNSYNAATVTGTAPFSTGGLVGYNAGHISSSYNSGAVVGVEVGGIAGELDYTGSIADSYNTGSVTSSGYAGGLVGNAFSGTIDRSYASGAVIGSTAGGIVGSLGSTVVNDVYWDTDTTGQLNAQPGGAVSGATGLTTANALAIVEGNTAPVLQSINTVISGTATGVANCVGCVGLIVDGADFGSALNTNASGFFYTVARSVDIASSSGVLAYLNTGSKRNAVTIQGTQGDAISGLVLDANTITVGDASTKTLSNSSLALGGGR